MTSKVQFGRIPSLSRSFIVFTLCFALVFFFSLLMTVSHYSKNFEVSVQSEAVSLRGQALRTNFEAAMLREWNSMNAVAKSIDPTSKNEVQDFMDAVVSASKAVAWAGFATTDGTVIAGSLRRREGQSVADQPWFRRGLERGFVGQVHEDRPLARFLQNESVRLFKYVDMSTPVTDGEGRVVGVVNYQVRVSWMLSYIKATADNLRLDAFLVDGSGNVMAEAINRLQTPLSNQSIGLAATGDDLAQVQTSPDGEDYVTATVPLFQNGSVPLNGWRFVARVPAQTSETGMRDLASSMKLVLLVLALLWVISVTTFKVTLLDPLASLSKSALSIAEGKDIYPPEVRGTREGAALSASLVKLQSRSELKTG